MTEKIPLRIKVTILLEFSDEKTAKTICKATAPENIETPKGTIAESSFDGEKISFQVETSSRFKDLITTIEDFFEKVDISRKTIDLLEKK